MKNFIASECRDENDDLPVKKIISTWKVWFMWEIQDEKTWKFHSPPNNVVTDIIFVRQFLDPSNEIKLLF